MFQFLNKKKKKKLIQEIVLIASKIQILGLVCLILFFGSFGKEKEEVGALKPSTVAEDPVAPWRLRYGTLESEEFLRCRELL